MAESTALAEHRDADTELHVRRTAGPGEPPAAMTTGAGQPAADELAAGELVAEDLLVEEVSIDGMCGVY